jgi:DNA-binding transcriptional LysR family regulator
MLDTRQLLVLARVARTGSYTAAASSLGYTQPAVSYQMRMLERAVGTPLVSHAGRGVRLTEAGRILARHADVVLAAIRTAESDLAAISAQGRGQVRLAAFQTCCATLVPAALVALRRSRPRIDVQVTQVEPPGATAQLRAGDIDLALICDWENEAVPEPDLPLRRVLLLTDRRCALLPAAHRLAQQESIDLADLAGERWVTETARDRFARACDVAGFLPQIVATADDQVTIQSLVASGIGIALMNELGLATHLDSRLVARPLRNWPLRRTYAQFWPDMAEVPAISALLRGLRTAARGLRLEVPGSPISTR